VGRLGGKVKNALDEARMLVLGAQVLLGFQYRAFMEPGFERLPPYDRSLKLAGLLLLLATLGFLLAPASRHRLVERGCDSTRLVGFTRNAVWCALMPFSAALGLDLFGAGEQIGGFGFGVWAGVVASLCVVVLWYAIPLGLRRASPPASLESEMSKPKLEERIQQVLTEARVVLPGAQALLGFQLAMMLMDAFDKLSPAARMLHFASLCCIALTAALLMAPPAFHRLAEHGEDTERLERFSGATVLASLVSLALGLSLDLAVVTERLRGSLEPGVCVAAICFAVLMTGWFGVSLWLRKLSR
jgi:hypothetical protein